MSKTVEELARKVAERIVTMSGYDRNVTLHTSQALVDMVERELTTHEQAVREGERSKFVNMLDKYYGFTGQPSLMVKIQNSLARNEAVILDKTSREAVSQIVGETKDVILDHLRHSLSPTNKNK